MEVKEEKKVKTKVEAEEKLPIMIPKSKEHKEPVWVCINGNGTLIERGKQVMVTKPVYEVLQNKFKMEELALERQEELQNIANDKKAFS